MLYFFEFDAQAQNSSQIDFKITHPSSIQSILISWNGYRSKQQGLQISLSLDQTQWEPYVYWGLNEQYSYESVGQFKIDQDIVTPHQTLFKTFYVRLKGDLKNIFYLNVFVKDASPESFTYPRINAKKVIDYQGFSQMIVQSPHSSRICSPVSTFSILNYLLKAPPDSLKNFMQYCYDKAFDIYGNWVLNIAAASQFLGPSWICSAAYLSHFHIILQQIEKGIPTVVSVRGSLPKAPLEYSQGHLMVIIGVDQQNIWCMDPAFPSDRETIVAYPHHNFFQAWKERNYLSYLFYPSSFLQQRSAMDRGKITAFNMCN